MNNGAKGRGRRTQAELLRGGYEAQPVSHIGTGENPCTEVRETMLKH